jgi:uncharacterized cysteine cluster protein YcgN (CxxCxxCC family)
MAKAKKSGSDTPSPDTTGGASSVPFWKTKSLEEMNAREWESLCDGCGRCCLLKLQDEDTEKIYFTDIACDLFDPNTCRCKDYKNRQAQVSDCVRLTPHEVRTLTWLPPTCAYRLIAEGKDLMDWHPLISKDPLSVQKAGVSVHGRVKAFEKQVPFEDVIDYIVSWPGKIPKSAKPASASKAKSKK